MASSDAVPSTGPAVRRSAAASRPRRVPDPARRRLGLAVTMVLLGSFLPWLYTTVSGPVSGARGPGLWTFYAGMLGLAGLLIPLRRVAAVQAGLLAATAMVLPLWQVARLLRLVGVSGWYPGPGLLLVFVGGLLAAAAARALWRTAAVAG